MYMYVCVVCMFMCLCVHSHMCVQACMCVHIKHISCYLLAPVIVISCLEGRTGNRHLSRTSVFKNVMRERKKESGFG